MKLGITYTDASPTLSNRTDRILLLGFVFIFIFLEQCGTK